MSKSTDDEYWAYVKEVAQRVSERPIWARGAIDRPANVSKNPTVPSGRRAFGKETKK